MIPGQCWNPSEIYCSVLLSTSFWIFTLSSRFVTKHFTCPTEEMSSRPSLRVLILKLHSEQSPVAPDFSTGYGHILLRSDCKDVCPFPIPHHLEASSSLQMDVQQAAYQLPSQDVEPITRSRHFVLKCAVPDIKQGSIVYSVQKDQKLTVTLQVR